MTRINDEFMEAFKHLDKICKEMFNAEKGVTSYIDEMEPGRVEIHLYDNIGTHDATTNWYDVEKRTGFGTDTSMYPVDLSLVVDCLR